MGYLLCLLVQSKAFHRFVETSTGFSCAWWSSEITHTTTSNTTNNTANGWYDSVELLGNNSDSSDSNDGDNRNSYHGKSYQSL